MNVRIHVGNILRVLLGLAVYVCATMAFSAESGLSLLAKNEGKDEADYQFKLGERLLIRATGDSAKAILDEQAKGTAGSFTLYLDGIAMPGLKAYAESEDGGNAARLGFSLLRESNDDNNRKAWDRLFSQHHEYVMPVRVALGIGSVAPIGVVPSHSTRELAIYVASPERITLIMGGALILFAVSFFLLVRNKSALRDSNGGHYSLGKSQMAFWGLIVLISFCALWILTGSMERIPSQALVLLGISGATGLGAVIIGSDKQDKREAELQTTLQKLRDEQQTLEAEQAQNTTLFTNAKSTRLQQVKTELTQLEAENTKLVSKGAIDASFWRDICDDGTGTSFHRLQIVLWTLALGVVFIYSVAKTMSMPEFSDTLLILMGISSGTYLGFKFPEK